MSLGPKSLAGLNPPAVLPPKAAPRPKIVKNNANGIVPCGGDRLDLSDRANTTPMSTAVPKNSSKKQLSAGRYGCGIVKNSPPVAVGPWIVRNPSSN